jgi:hypothetical protein
MGWSFHELHRASRVCKGVKSLVLDQGSEQKNFGCRIQGSKYLLGEDEPRHAVRHNERAVPVNLPNECFRLGGVCDGADGVGVRVVDKRVGDEGMEDGLDGGARGIGIQHGLLLDVDEFLIGLGHGQFGVQRSGDLRLDLGRGAGRRGREEGGEREKRSLTSREGLIGASLFSLYVCMNLYMSACMYACMYVCMYLRTYIHTNMCMFLFYAYI